MKADFEFDKFINEAFKEEPDFFLPANFANKLDERVTRRYSLTESLKEYSLYAALLAGLAIIVCGFLLFINKDNLPQLQNFITGHIIDIISLIFIANFVLFADKVLLRILFTYRQQ